MSLVKVRAGTQDAVEIFYELDVDRGLPALVLSNSLGTNLFLWEPQLTMFQQHFRVLRYDTRGHGRSEATPGSYSIDQLGRDVVALMDSLGVAKASFCGLSMGGMVGQWLGANASERLNKLVLCNTAAKIGTTEIWNARIAQVAAEGMSSIIPGVLERWFTPEFRAATPEVVLSTQRMLESTDPGGYAACCAAIRDMDLRGRVADICVPTLVVTGAKDPVTSPSDGRFLVEQIAGAEYLELMAAHLSNVEAAAVFTPEVLRFLTA